MRARHRERPKPSISMRHPPAPVARFLSRARRRVRVPRARRRVRVPRARRRLLSLPRQFTLRAHQPFAHLDPHPTLNLQRARTRPRVLQRLRQRRSRVFHVRPVLRLHRAHHVVPRLQLPSQRLHAPRERRARITHAHHGSRARRCAPMCVDAPYRVRNAARTVPTTRARASRVRAAMGKPWLEGFQFAMYLAVPIALTASFALLPGNLERVIRDVRASRSRASCVHASFVARRLSLVVARELTDRASSSSS